LEKNYNFLSYFLKDSLISSYYNDFECNSYSKLTKNLVSLFLNYKKVCHSLCDEYKEAGLYEKLLQHCRFILKKDPVSIYPWFYLSKAYLEKGQIHYAKSADNIYQMIQKLRKKRFKKIIRRNRRNQFIWRYLIRFFHPRYYIMRKIKREEKKRHRKSHISIL